MAAIDIGLYNENPILLNPFDIFVQEIDILFDTQPTEILGYPLCGIDWNNYVWDLNKSTQMISREVESIIYTYATYASKFRFTVGCEVLYGSKSDIILLTLDLWDSNDKQYKKTYKF